MVLAELVPKAALVVRVPKAALVVLADPCLSVPLHQTALARPYLAVKRPATTVNAVSLAIRLHLPLVLNVPLVATSNVRLLVRSLQPALSSNATP